MCYLPFRLTWHRCAAAAGLTFLASCNLLTGGTYCTANVVPAVVVRIVDAQSGAPLAAGATGIVRDGSFWDRLRPSGFITVGDSVIMVSRQAADEHPGTYRVEVFHPGYAPAVLDGVSVEPGACHVVTREVEIRLTPLSKATLHR